MNENKIKIETHQKEGICEYPKASSLIEALQEAMRKFGDLPVHSAVNTNITDEINSIFFIDDGKGYLSIDYV